MTKAEVIDKIMQTSLDRAAVILRLGDAIGVGDLDVVNMMQGTIRTYNGIIEEYAKQLVAGNGGAAP